MNQSLVRQKMKAPEAIPGAGRRPSSPGKSLNPRKGKEACEALELAKKARSMLTDQVMDLNQEGVDKKQKCKSMEGEPQRQCLEQLQPLRDKIQEISGEMALVDDKIRKYESLCPGAIFRETENRKLYEYVAREACSSSGDAKRCEDALFNLAELNYEEDQRKNIAAWERYEREPLECEHGRRRQPVLYAPSYAKGLAANLKYLKRLPSGARRDVILYRTAFIYDLMGRSPDAFPLLMEISRNYPNSRKLSAVQIRIGEYYFVDKKYDSAIAYYLKVDSEALVNKSIPGLAFFHKGEAFYEKANFQVAVDAFFDYIERSDKGQFRGEFRSEAILYMGSCFARLPGSYKDAKSFFASRGGRPYEDTLFYELAVHHVDRDQYDQAIAALDDFLETFPDYYKAPLAQIKLVEIWDKKRKIHEAQAAREQLAQKYGPNSPWWQKSRSIGKRELQQIQDRVRDIAFEFAKHQHEAGKENRDSLMVGKAVSSYRKFIEEYLSEGNWPIYTAKVQLADALSFLARHEEAADEFLWIARENVNDAKKYREPTSKERKLIQSTEAAFLAIAQLQLAATKEITKQGGDTVRAYSQPTTKRYLDAVENYLAKYPNANEAPAIACDRFQSRINGRDWANAISDGNRLIEKWPDFDRINDIRTRLEYAITQDSAKTDGPH
ncbi:MAG: tetratricopeptide repeat protein [Fibrobacteres bacterium]|nr:tetratricopeptide repeat protein [Fibrobacterota bacterium]